MGCSDSNGADGDGDDGALQSDRRGDPNVGQGPNDVRAPNDAGVPEDANAPDSSTSILPSTAKPVVIDGDNTFADITGKMSKGDWVEYETTAAENYFRNGKGGHDLTWAESAVWDAKSKCILHYGGGHLTIPAFSIYCVSSNEWIRGTLPPWLDLEGSVWHYTNHGYDRNAFDPITRRLFFYRMKELWIYELQTDKWRNLQLDMGNYQARDFAEFFPGLGVILGRGEPKSRLLRVDDLDAGKTVHLEKAAFHDTLHTFGEYSAKHDMMLYGGGNDKTATYLLKRDGQSITTAPSPHVISTVASGKAGGWVVVDPHSGDFLALFAKNGELHRYSPTTNKWTLEAISPLKPPMISTISASLPEYGVVLFATRISNSKARITLYRP